VTEGAVNNIQIGENRRLCHAWNNRYLYLMLIPAMAYVILFFYLPMGGIVIAFQRFNYTQGIFGSDWVGLKNFKFLFMSNKLWFLTRNTLLYNLAFIVFGMICEVSLAIFINEISRLRFKRLFQSFIVLPYFISWVVVAGIVQSMLGYEYGMINRLLENIGIGRINIYANAGIWPVLLVFIRLWKMTGYGSIVLWHRLQGLIRSCMKLRPLTEQTCGSVSAILHCRGCYRR